MADTIETVWECWTYDVLGNKRDGYDVNDRSCFDRAYPLTLAVEVMNPGTEHEFRSASPTDAQIRELFGIGKRVQIETDGDDRNIYVTRARDSYPIGEMFCTSHQSLSPIREQSRWDVIVGNIGTVYSGDSEAAARNHFREYVEQSRSGVGRAGNEDVTLMQDEEIVQEHQGTQKEDHA